MITKKLARGWKANLIQNSQFFKFRVCLAQLFLGIQVTLNLKLKLWALKLKLFGKCYFLFQIFFYVKVFDNIFLIKWIYFKEAHISW